MIGPIWASERPAADSTCVDDHGTSGVGPLHERRHRDGTRIVPQKLMNGPEDVDRRSAGRALEEDVHRSARRAGADHLVRDAPDVSFEAAAADPAGRIAGVIDEELGAGPPIRGSGDANRGRHGSGPAGGGKAGDSSGDFRGLLAVLHRRGRDVERKPTLHRGTARDGRNSAEQSRKGRSGSRER